MGFETWPGFGSRGFEDLLVFPIVLVPPPILGKGLLFCGCPNPARGFLACILGTNSLIGS